MYAPPFSKNTNRWYDQEGAVRAAGAEAERESMIAEAEDNNYVKAELFKLRLRPRAMKLQMNGMALSSLPRGKSPVDVFADFLAYLFRCTRAFIEDTHAAGPALWAAVSPAIQFVLSHPNGWEGAQQSKMRRAAVRGGLIPDTDAGRARIRFVTEGEASLHACVLNGLANDVLSVGISQYIHSAYTHLVLRRTHQDTDSLWPTQEAARSIFRPTPSAAPPLSLSKKSPLQTVSCSIFTRI
jgi:hypothetical protein